MRFACWITKAIETRSKFVTVGAFYYSSDVIRPVLNVTLIQCDSFGTRPKKMIMYLKDYSLDCEYAYMTIYLASWEACRYLFAALWHPDVIGTTTGVWRHVAHSRVVVLCGSEGEWHTQRICGSTWWWRAPKRLFSTGWSHMPHLEWLKSKVFLMTGLFRKPYGHQDLLN